MYTKGQFKSYLFQELKFANEKSRYTQVYTDASFAGGELTHEYHTGIGVWFGEDDPRNVSKTVKATSSLEGELMAICEALRLLNKEGGIERYEICTDSLSSIGFLNRHCVPKSYVVLKLVDWFDFHKHSVRLTHVKGHSGLKGNIMAHKLAKQGRLKGEPC